jgi:hypothetical protein
MWKLWEENKEEYYEWLDKNFYEVPSEGQMDIDKDILQYGNKQYHPDLCLIVPHSINVFCMISTMSGQFQLELPIFEKRKNMNIKVYLDANEGNNPSAISLLP